MFAGTYRGYEIGWLIDDVICRCLKCGKTITLGEKRWDAEDGTGPGCSEEHLRAIFDTGLGAYDPEKVVVQLGYRGGGDGR